MQPSKNLNRLIKKLISRQFELFIKKNLKRKYSFQTISMNWINIFVKKLL
jgi:disulfide oxidoreductase YuzD